MSLRKRSILTKTAIKLLLILGLAGCRSAPPKVDLKIYAGDSARAGVTRKQSDETISCADPKIDELGCMPYEDIKKLFDLLWACKQWGPEIARMNRREAKEALDIYLAVASKAAK